MYKHCKRCFSEHFHLKFEGEGCVAYICARCISNGEFTVYAISKVATENAITAPITAKGH